MQSVVSGPSVDSSLPLRQLLPEIRAHAHALFEEVEVELLVGGMGAVVGQGQAEEQGVGAEDFLEVHHDGDGAAFAHDNGFLAESLLQGAERGLRGGAGGGDEVGFAAVEVAELDLHRGGADLLQMGESHRLWFMLDTARHDYRSAVNHLLSFKQLNDSLFTDTKRRQISELEIQYETEKKEKDILLKAQNIQSLTENRRGDQQCHYEKTQGLLHYSVNFLILLLLNFKRCHFG